MTYFESPYGAIALTDERKRHIFTFHPDIRPYMRHFAATLLAPDRVLLSVHDQSVLICYKLLSKPDKWLAIVIKTGVKPFVLTAYLAKKPKKI